MVTVSIDLPEHTAEAITEAEALLIVNVPHVVTMRQARLALLEVGLLAVIETAIISGTDEAMKIEWEYATEVQRDWHSLISLATMLNITSAQLDDLFLLSSTL
jgi:hypothetical protein